MRDLVLWLAEAAKRRSIGGLYGNREHYGPRPRAAPAMLASHPLQTGGAGGLDIDQSRKRRLLQPRDEYGGVDVLHQLSPLLHERLNHLQLIQKCLMR